MLALKRSQEVSDHMLWIVKDPSGLLFGTEVSVVKRNNEFIWDIVNIREFVSFRIGKTNLALLVENGDWQCLLTNYDMDR